MIQASSAFEWHKLHSKLLSYTSQMGSLKAQFMLLVNWSPAAFDPDLTWIGLTQVFLRITVHLVAKRLLLMDLMRAISAKAKGPPWNLLLAPLKTTALNSVGLSWDPAGLRHHRTDKLQRDIVVVPTAASVTRITFSHGGTHTHECTRQKQFELQRFYRLARPLCLMQHCSPPQYCISTLQADSHQQ